MKEHNRTSRKAKHKPAGHKLWRSVLKHKYGKLWREYADLG